MTGNQDFIYKNLFTGIIYIYNIILKIINCQVY